MTSDHNAVLFANSAFYAAFAARDAAAMEKVWAKDKMISCTHPGWQPLVGRAEVTASWRSILGNASAPKISCRAERAVVYGDFAIVTCIEQISDEKGESEFLTATNIFVRTGSLWAMVHHQAGPVNLEPNSLEEEEKPALN
jgi:ketosteroid isomerase-like protein